MLASVAARLRRRDGRIFSVVVLLTGTSFILVVLPFAFLQFVFTPWMESREAARAPRELSANAAGHAVLAHLDAVTDAFIERLGNAEVPYVLLDTTRRTAPPTRSTSPWSSSAAAASAALPPARCGHRGCRRRSSNSARNGAWCSSKASRCSRCHLVVIGDEVAERTFVDEFPVDRA